VKKIIMKSATIFALFALAFVIAVSADDDVCGVLSLVDKTCVNPTAVDQCHSCLVDKCNYLALKDNTNCEEIQDCISNSGCH
jgi:hypothetical protein